LFFWRALEVEGAGTAIAVVTRCFFMWLLFAAMSGGGGAITGPASPSGNVACGDRFIFLIDGLYR